MSNRKMSKYMTEKIYTFSDTAVLKHLDNNFINDAQFKVACNISIKVYDPIGNFYAPKKLIPSSCFRGKKLNAAVLGDEHSDHCINILLGGAAIDLNVKGVDPKQVFNDIFTGKIKQANGKPLKEIIDQCIYEERHTKQGVQRWVHCSTRTNPRRQFMYSLDGSHYATATKTL